jgi:glutamine---fructose-6-phosphate transaminase (isomerizing)
MSRGRGFGDISRLNLLFRYSKNSQALNIQSLCIFNIKEVKSRKSPVIALVDEEDTTTESMVDMVIKIPHTLNIFSPVVNCVALQLLAYHVARVRNCPIDFPRNLAKSVTVE